MDTRGVGASSGSGHNVVVPAVLTGTMHAIVGESKMVASSVLFEHEHPPTNFSFRRLRVVGASAKIVLL